MRPFGREPALWLAVLQAAIGILVGFGLDWLTAEQAALWMVVVNALLGAWTAILTRPIAPTAFTHLFAVAATLIAAYGFDLSQGMVTSINGLIIAVVMLISRGEISPADDAHKTGVLGDKVTTGVSTAKTY